MLSGFARGILGIEVFDIGVKHFCFVIKCEGTKVGIICQLGNLLMGRMGRLGGLRRVGVRAAPAIMGRVGQVRRVGQVGQVGQVGG